MIRVTLYEGRHEDFEHANSASVSADGSLILARVEVRQVVGQDLKARTEISNHQLVTILASETWLRADNLELDLMEDREE